MRAPSLNAFTESPTMRGPAPTAAPQQAALPQQKSFLDEWLAKQQNQQPQSSPIAAPSSAPMPTPQVQPATPQAQTVVPIQPATPDAQHISSPIASPAGNISSSTLDNTEVSGIAAELRKGLDRSQEGTVSLTSPNSVDEDTIYIGKDGSFHAKSDMADSSQA